MVAREPVLEAGSRLPAQPLAGARRVGLEDHDLAGVGSQALRVLDGPGLPTEDAAGEREELADRFAPAGAELDDLALDAGAVAARMKPSTVSATNVRSRRVSRRPSRTSVLPARSWRSIVGSTARSDWRGP